MNKLSHFLVLNYAFGALSVFVNLGVYRYVALNYAADEASFFYFTLVVVMIASGFELGYSRGIVALLGEKGVSVDSVVALSIIGGITLGLVGSIFVSIALNVFSFNVIDSMLSDHLLSLSLIVGVSIFNIIQIAFIDNTKKFIFGFLLKLLNQIFFLVIVFFPLDYTILSLYDVMFIVKLIPFALIWLYMLTNYRFKNIDKKAVHLLVNKLLKFLGWSSVSTISGSVVNSIDRVFILNNFEGSSSYNNYSIIADNTLKGVSITGILASSILPFVNDGNVRKVRRALWAILSLMSLGFTILATFFSNSILHLWLGDSYDDSMQYILIALIPGLIFTGFAQQYLVSLQSRGLVKGPALMHLAVGCFYVLILLIFIESLSLVHIAMFWSVRALVDAVILAFIHSENES